MFAMARNQGTFEIAKTGARREHDWRSPAQTRARSPNSP
jgi:hypothetical protein